MDYFIAVRSALGTAVSKRSLVHNDEGGRLSAFLWRREQAKIAGVDVDVTFTISHVSYIRYLCKSRYHTF